MKISKKKLASTLFTGINFAFESPNDQYSEAISVLEVAVALFTPAQQQTFLRKRMVRELLVAAAESAAYDAKTSAAS